MLYKSNNPEGRDRRMSSGQSTGGAGAEAGESATTNTTTKDIFSSKALSNPVKRQNLDYSASYMRQISHDSNNASDGLGSGMRSDFSAPSRGCSPTANKNQQLDSPLALGRGNPSQETTTHKLVDLSQMMGDKMTTATTSESTQSFAQTRLDPGHSGYTELNYHQQHPAQGVAQSRWAASSAQSFSAEIPVVAMGQGCCLAQPTGVSCCSMQSQPISGQQGGDQPEEDDPYEPEDAEESLDYKPILAKILNEKKLALLSAPEVIAFLNNGKPGTTPTAHRQTHM